MLDYWLLVNAAYTQSSCVPWPPVQYNVITKVPLSIVTTHKQDKEISAIAFVPERNYWLVL